MKNFAAKGIFISVAFIALISISTAYSECKVTELYNTGNEQYRSENWEAALELYLAAVDSGACASDLFFNIGCAYFRMGEIGNAVLWFERARIIEPRDKDVKKNISFVRKLTQDRIESIYRGTLLLWFWKLIEGISFSEFWWMLLIISLLATCATAYSVLQLRGYWAALILWIVFFLCAGVWYVKGERLWERHLAIVLSPKLDVRSAPSDESELLFTIHSGTRVAIMEERHDWYRISIEDGHTGWTGADYIEPVICKLVP